MMENLLTNEEYDFETPYLRRWREKGLAEGRAEVAPRATLRASWMDLSKLY
jgi:hypothetical protein